MRERKAPITVTAAALEKIRAFLVNKDPKPLGIRIGLKSKGCSGLSYVFEFVQEEQAMDEKVVIEELVFYIEPKAMLYILGTEIDYEEGEIESGFTFKNPNEKGRCGCGESFHV